MVTRSLSAPVTARGRAGGSFSSLPGEAWPLATFQLDMQFHPLTSDWAWPAGQGTVAERWGVSGDSAHTHSQSDAGA